MLGRAYIIYTQEAFQLITPYNILVSFHAMPACLYTSERKM